MRCGADRPRQVRGVRLWASSLLRVILPVIVARIRAYMRNTLVTYYLALRSFCFGTRVRIETRARTDLACRIRLRDLSVPRDCFFSRSNGGCCTTRKFVGAHAPIRLLRPEPVCFSVRGRLPALSILRSAGRIRLGHRLRSRQRAAPFAGARPRARDVARRNYVKRTSAPATTCARTRNSREYVRPLFRRPA